MKAAMLYGVKDLRIEDVEIPKVGLGEVLVKVKAATTCGTDLKIFRRGYIEKNHKTTNGFRPRMGGRSR